MARPSPRLAMPVDQAVRLICLSHLDAARAALVRLPDATDGEALHDFRVAVRRLRSTLRAYQDHLDDPIPKKLRRRLRDLQQTTNAGRDAEVALEWLATQRGSVTPRQRYGVDWLSERLDAQRREASSGAAEHVTRDFERVARALSQRLSRYHRRLRVAKDDAPTPLASAAAALVRHHATVLAQEMGQVAGPDDQEAVHSARIAAKRLRYLLEPIRDELPDAAPLVAQLKRLQDITGAMHDAQVFETDLGSAIEAAGAERARRIYDEAATGDVDPTALQRAARKDERPGLLALMQLAAARRAADFAELRERWIGDGPEAFFASLKDVATTMAALAHPGVEIERKFLLRDVPPRAREAPHVEIEQGWLPGSVLQERLRRVRSDDGERLLRTIKHGDGVARLELEEAAPPDLFGALWPLTEGRRLTKRRYTVVEGDRAWEIDEFTDRDLVLAEVELPTPDASAVPPEWLAPHVEREVTGEPDYLNVNLAR